VISCQEKNNKKNILFYAGLMPTYPGLYIPALLRRGGACIYPAWSVTAWRRLYIPAYIYISAIWRLL